MKRYRFLLRLPWLFLLALVFAPLAWTQVPEVRASAPFEEELFHFGVRAWDGLTLSYHGVTSGTNFGFDPSLQDALERYPQSRDLFRRYQNLNSAGNICLWGGVGLALTGLFLPSWSGNSSPTMLGFSVGTVLTGLTSSLVGALLLPASENQIARSAEAFNRERLIQLRP
jgi:hypothetical protein